MFTVFLTPIAAIPTIAIWDRLPDGAINRIFGLLESVTGSSQGGLDTSASARLDLASLAVKMFNDSPILGHGVGSFFTLSSSDPEMVTADYPHNLFLHALSELGTIGFIVIAIFVVYCMVVTLTGMKKSSYNMALLAIAVNMLVNAMFSNSMYDFRILWASLIAAACAALAHADTTSAADSPPVRRLTFRWSGRGSTRVQRGAPFA